ncbi:MAG: hypothetical protein QXZ14_06425 [Candidatus Jordarchaeales archaeon]|nr:AbrB family transcriptional regulator [Candidatus Jordarchaeia archaeon]
MIGEVTVLIMAASGSDSLLVTIPASFVRQLNLCERARIPLEIRAEENNLVMVVESLRRNEF